jgi:hypothetical protein
MPTVVRPSLQAGQNLQGLAPITQRVEAEYVEMPGLCLTLAQASRLFGLDKQTCQTILKSFVQTGFLRESAGRFLRV